MNLRDVADRIAVELDAADLPFRSVTIDGGAQTDSAVITVHTQDGDYFTLRVVRLA